MTRSGSATVGAPSSAAGRYPVSPDASATALQRRSDTVTAVVLDPGDLETAAGRTHQDACVLDASFGGRSYQATS